MSLTAFCKSTTFLTSVFINLKKSLGNITKNSVETPAELQAKIEYYINKNTTITKGLERANEKIKNMKEQYDCVVKQNEELKKENAGPIKSKQFQLHKNSPIWLFSFFLLILTVTIFTLIFEN